MKVLLDIKDAKADFVMELLESFSFVKAKTITPQKAEVLEGIKEAIEEINLVKAGKLKGRNAEELFDEV
ncbi:hypothetical protein [Pedobacter alpinus]|uniref:Uncharacterized protein n=1 Tax=Pedobacter alpinus TaxID=1590643 RepID=A0ABW5TMZ4_9SPHI